jgi:hypothetical protein
MALHYFHMSNGHTTLDQIGTDHPDHASVRNEAVRTFRELLNLGPTESLWTGDPWKIWVTDGPNASGKTVVTLELFGQAGR